MDIHGDHGHTPYLNYLYVSRCQIISSLAYAHHRRHHVSWTVTLIILLILVGVVFVLNLVILTQSFKSLYLFNYSGVPDTFAFMHHRPLGFDCCPSSSVEFSVSESGLITVPGDRLTTGNTSVSDSDD